MKHRRGKEFKNHVKETAYRRDNGRCVSCGSKENLEYHHILPLFVAHHFGLTDQLLRSVLNCETTCHDCHIERHNEYRKMSVAEFAPIAYALLGMANQTKMWDNE